MGTTYTRQQPAYYDVEDRDDLYETRIPSSARRYKPYETVDDPKILQYQNTYQNSSAIQRRRSNVNVTGAVRTNTTRTTATRTSSAYAPRQSSGAATSAVKPSRTVDVRRDGHSQRKSHKRFKPTLLLGMIVAVVLLAGLTSLVSWWQGFQQDITYGNPRTSQIDAVVGHSDSAAHPTHFVFINLHGNIEVIEMQGGDAAKTHKYDIPTLNGSGQDLTPVTGNIVNQQGKINLIVHVGSQNFLFVNDGKTFQLH
jgi:hypothetical protein